MRGSRAYFLIQQCRIPEVIRNASHNVYKFSSIRADFHLWMYEYSMRREGNSRYSILFKNSVA